MADNNTISELPVLTNQKEYKIHYSGEEYSIKIGKNNNYLTIIVKSTNDTSNSYQIGEYTLHKLLDLSKVFWSFDSISDALKEIQESANKTIPTLSSNKSDELFLNLSIESYLSVDEIKFKLTKKFVIHEEENEVAEGEVENGVSSVEDQKLKKKINEMKLEISELRKEMNMIKIRIDSQDDKIYEKHRQLLVKLRNESDNKKTIEDKEKIINDLMKRIEKMEEINKKFEGFMKKEKEINGKK